MEMMYNNNSVEVQNFTKAYFTMDESQYETYTMKNGKEYIIVEFDKIFMMNTDYSIRAPYAACGYTPSGKCMVFIDELFNNASDTLKELLIKHEIAHLENNITSFEFGSETTPERECILESYIDLLTGLEPSHIIRSLAEMYCVTDNEEIQVRLQERMKMVRKGLEEVGRLFANEMNNYLVNKIA